MTEEHYITQGGTQYRWVGNLPDLRRPNGWERIALVFPMTTKKSWQKFLKGSIFSDPIPHEGKTTAELKALEMIGAWKPLYMPSAGHSIEMGEDRGLFDFDFGD